MIYPSAVSAVVRALAAEVLTDVSQCWKDPGAIPAGRGSAIAGKEEAFLTDCWINARLRANLDPHHWRVLIAKYSTHAERKHAAIVEITKVMVSPAPDRFRNAAVLTWAMPKLMGVEGKRSTSVLPMAWYCMDNWCDDPTPVKTQERWRRDIRKAIERDVDNALMAAQEILDAEGLIREAA